MSKNIFNKNKRKPELPGLSLTTLIFECSRRGLDVNLVRELSREDQLALLRRSPIISPNISKPQSTEPAITGHTYESVMNKARQFINKRGDIPADSPKASTPESDPKSLPSNFDPWEVPQVKKSRRDGSIGGKVEYKSALSSGTPASGIVFDRESFEVEWRTFAPTDTRTASDVANFNATRDWYFASRILERLNYPEPWPESHEVESLEYTDNKLVINLYDSKSSGRSNELDPPDWIRHRVQPAGYKAREFNPVLDEKSGRETVSIQPIRPGTTKRSFRSDRRQESSGNLSQH